MATTFSTTVNNYVSLVSVGRAIAGPTIVVASATGLPTLSAGQFFRLSVYRNNSPLTILKVTGVDHGTGTLTISGALEFPDVAIQENDVVMVADTAGLFTELQSAINNIEVGTTSLPVLATNSTTLRTLNDRFSDFYNVLDWGVKGDGTTDDAPAINALIAFVTAQASFKTRTIYFPAGNYAVHSPIYVAKALGTGQQTTAVRIIGDGYQSQIVSANPVGMTEIIRIEDSASGIFRRFRLFCNLPVTVAALHITAITSGENNKLSELAIDCNNQCPVGIGVSLDNHQDVAQIDFEGCKVTGATKAGIKIGDGVSGNVLDIRFHHCQSLHNPVGVWMDAAPVIWFGGATTDNSVSDFFMSGGCGDIILIEGVRSEQSNMFFLSRGGGSIPPIRISDVVCFAWAGLTYIYNSQTQTFTPDTVEGFVISHRYIGVMTIMNCAFLEGPAVRAGGRFDVNSPCSVTVVNCMTGIAAASATSYRNSSYYGGGRATGLDFTVLGGKAVTTGGTAYDSAINAMIDGPAFFNGQVALNTMAPTTGFHQVGGSFWLQNIDDPLTPPTITNSTGGGATTYTYYYVYKDGVGNQTLPSPAGTTTTGHATLDAINYNIVTIPTNLSVTTIDILRGDTGHYVALNWNPYISTPNFVYNDILPSTSVYVTPTRNATADMTIDGTLNAIAPPLGSTTPLSMVQRFTNQQYNVLDWGVTGGGIVDDQPAIMALLRYVSNLTTSSSGRRTIYFPAGSYLIGNPIKVGKQYHLKADGSSNAPGTAWPGINLIGDGYSTQFVSGNASGMSEMMLIEDVSVSKVEGFRFLVAVGSPVTRAAFHITAINSGETHFTKDIFVECQSTIGGSCPVGIGVSLNYPNDTAQVNFINCKSRDATYAGIMIGNSMVGNVLDVRFWGCQSIGSPVGVFGNASPIFWSGGITSYNYIADFYQNGPSTGPTLIDGVRSENSNKIYANFGGSDSRSPITISNCTIAAWRGVTWTVANGKPPWFTMPVTVTNGSTTVTGTGTLWKTRSSVLVGSKLVFANDATFTPYTVDAITDDVTITLHVAYTGAAGTTSTFADLVQPVFTKSLTGGVDTNMSVVLSTSGGVTTVTGTGTHFNTQLTTNNYLVFDNDIHHLTYQIASISSATVLTMVDDLTSLTGSTTCNCPLIEAYAIAHRSGGVFHMQSLTFTHSPANRYYARFNFSASNLYVTAVNVNTGVAGATALSDRGNIWNAGDWHTTNGMRFTVLPGPSNTTIDGNCLNSLGFLCDSQANFNDKVSLNIYDGQSDQYHQVGGGMHLQKLADPNVAINDAQITHGGTPGAATYYYWYVAKDLLGHRTLVSPTGTPTTTGNATISSTNTNIIAIPHALPNSLGVASYDILRNTTNTLSGANFGSVAVAWNPYTGSPQFSYVDTAAAPTAYTFQSPLRNQTGDILVDGTVLMNGQTTIYPGSGAGEVNGAQTADATFTSKNQTMLQTVYNLARATGLLA